MQIDNHHTAVLFIDPQIDVLSPQLRNRVVLGDSLTENGPRHPDWGDGYAAAMINYRYLAHAVLRTAHVVAASA